MQSDFRLPVFSERQREKIDPVWDSDFYGILFVVFCVCPFLWAAGEISFSME